MHASEFKVSYPSNEKFILVPSYHKFVKRACENAIFLKLEISDNQKFEQVKIILLDIVR